MWFDEKNMRTRWVSCSFNERRKAETLNEKWNGCTQSNRGVFTNLHYLSPRRSEKTHASALEKRRRRNNNNHNNIIKI